MTKGEGWKKAAAAGMLSIAMVFALTACGEKKENRTVSKRKQEPFRTKKEKRYEKGGSFSDRVSGVWRRDQFCKWILLL